MSRLRENAMLEERLPNVAERGFTLVELMVVVAIIALIASIVITNNIH
jgi:prepilin-type N-terminal cleavage/methylation domain-containing protein